MGGSFSGLGIGLSFVFGCILMGLVAELYYLLWWKKRITRNTSIESSSISSNREMVEFSFLFCWKRPVSSFNSASSSQELTNSVRNNPTTQEDLEMGSTTAKDKNNYGEEEIETELMRMHNLCGPPRFLFTIKEESKEDLESESSRKGSRTKSLSTEVVFAVDGIGTPYLTPLSSPPPTIKTSPLDSYSNIHGFNPLFESLSEAELNKLRSSPPPKFKFLKDAEDKLIKRLLMEEAERLKIEEEKDVSFVSFVDSKSLVRDHQQLHNQSSSQVLPLASSPTYQPVVQYKNTASVN